MKLFLSTFVCFSLLLFSGLQGQNYSEGYYISFEEESWYKDGLDFSYNNIINILNEKINITSERIEIIKESSNEYWLEKRNFYIDCKHFYIDCKQMIESKYPTQTEERENALKFIETTRMW